jgi:hypothetical protein
MLRKIRRLPSPALVISIVALIVAIGGGTYAIAISGKQTKKIVNKQIKKKAPNLTVKRADVADNAKNLGQKPASAFLRSNGVRADGAGSTSPIDNFTTPTYTNLVSKTFSAPTKGFIELTGTISTEDDGSIPGNGFLLYRLVVDGTPLSNNDFAHGISTNAAGGVLQGSGAVTAVVAVSGGSHTVNLQAREVGTGDFVEGRELSSVFTPAGTAPTIPFKGKAKANRR